MAMKDDSDFPRLTPPDDRYPAPGGLLRKPEELSDDQFDLLAAAWAEDSLEGDSLTELNTVLAGAPSRRARAESFRRVTLTPYNDSWIYRDSLLKQSPVTRVIRRTLVITLLSAAAVVAIIITGPVIRSRTTVIMPGTLPQGTVISEVFIPEAYPVIIPDRTKKEPSGAHRVTVTEWQAARLIPSTPDPAGNVAAGDIADPGEVVSGTDITETVKAVMSAEMADQARALPVTLAINNFNPALITAAVNADLQAVQMATILPSPALDKADNWIIRGFSLLAKTVTREEKNIDGYVIASACVNGINNVLGWDMQLEQSNNKSGVPVAVNFSSSLISFSAPVNKNSQ
jgi:hypothetical protein